MKYPILTGEGRPGTESNTVYSTGGQSSRSVLLGVGVRGCELGVGFGLRFGLVFLKVGGEWG